MANETPESKVPVVISLALVVAALIIAAVGGFGQGSILGGLVAAGGAVAAAYGAWVGIQQKTQGTLGLSILMLVVSLGVAGLLFLLRVVDWLR